MSLGWKKFNFFDRSELKASDLPKGVTCYASSSDALFLGRETGQVKMISPPDKVSAKMH